MNPEIKIATLLEREVFLASSVFDASLSTSSRLFPTVDSAVLSTGAAASSPSSAFLPTPKRLQSSSASSGSRRDGEFVSVPSSCLSLSPTKAFLTPLYSSST